MAAGEREQGEAKVGRKGLDRFRYEYGAQPLHLIALIASFALAGYGLLRINDLDNTGRILIWIVALALFHDLIALPLYSLLSRIAHGATSRAIESRAMALHALNHIRIPVGLSLLLLAVYFPLILSVAPEAYNLTTGQDTDVYLGRWLLISAGLFLISGILYAIRLRRGISGPEPMLAPTGEREEVPPESAFWRVGTGVVLGLSALAIFWVAAALIVGLLTTGISP